MGAKRPEPVPSYPRSERFNDTDGDHLMHVRDEEHPKLVNQLLAERDDLRQQLEASREREQKLRDALNTINEMSLQPARIHLTEQALSRRMGIIARAALRDCGEGEADAK